MRFHHLLYGRISRDYKLPIWFETSQISKQSQQWWRHDTQNNDTHPNNKKRDTQLNST
jgi:hypothetical protein